MGGRQAHSHTLCVVASAFCTPQLSLMFSVSADPWAPARWHSWQLTPPNAESSRHIPEVSSARWKVWRLLSASHVTQCSGTPATSSLWPGTAASPTAGRRSSHTATGTAARTPVCCPGHASPQEVMEKACLPSVAMATVSLEALSVFPCPPQAQRGQPSAVYRLPPWKSLTVTSSPPALLILSQPSTFFLLFHFEAVLESLRKK